MTITSKDIASLSVTFPWPPTVNTYRTPMVVGGRARLILSKPARDYHKATQWLWIQRGHRKLTGRLAVHVTTHAPDRRARDLDNLNKAILDSLVNAGAFDDDSQIDDLRVVRGAVDPASPRVEIAVAEITPT